MADGIEGQKPKAATVARGKEAATAVKEEKVDNEKAPEPVPSEAAPAVRARALAAKNRKRKAAGKKPLPPVENYYGWLINSKEADLRQLL